MGIIEAFILGIVEGLTEFLPISSTGHLILTSKILGIEQGETHKSFEIIIQLGSICAVIFVYFKKLISDFNLLAKLGAAFIPTGIVGFLFYKHIKELFAPQTVAYALIIGGVILIAIELFYKREKEYVIEIEKVSFKQAVLIGCAQCLSMIPGTSRSAATIVGGLLCGLDRKTAATFSFLLAVPTMIIATLYDLYKNYQAFDAGDITNLLVGFFTAFFIAIMVIKIFLRFISKFNFTPFGFYRIAIGTIFLWVVF
ncbi:undecaprenyl-diphosphatase [Campylobacterota bacterium]|nr:undecaprenyl-diphosphatase [Campylobacterota bacterium]